MIQLKYFMVAVLLVSSTASAGIGDLFSSVQEGISSGFSTAKRAIGMSDLTEDLEGTLIDKLLELEEGKTFEPLVKTELKEGYRKDVQQMRRIGDSPVQIKRLEQYLDRVLQRLILAWPGRPLHAKAYLVASRDFGGHALKHGAIFIPLGTLLLLENEDQLAALLAHELSHLIMEHHSSDALDWVTEKALDYGDLYVRMQAGSTKEMLGNYTKLKVTGWAARGALLPKWKRGQENEADILGIDLMQRAGYNADAMVRWLKMIGASAQEKQAYVANNPIQLNNPDNGQVGFKLDFALLIGGLTESLEEQFSYEHESAQKRRKRVRRYLKRAYPDRDRTPFMVKTYNQAMKQQSVRSMVARYKKAYAADDTLAAADKLKESDLNKASALGLSSVTGPTKFDNYNRLILYQIRMMQNRHSAAIKNLEFAIQSGQGSYQTYALLEENAFRQGEYKKSLSYLAQMQTEFGDDPDLLPRLIRVNHRLGQATVPLETACLATGKMSLIQRCENAKKLHPLPAGFAGNS